MPSFGITTTKRESRGARARRAGRASRRRAAQFSDEPLRADQLVARNRRASRRSARNVRRGEVSACTNAPCGEARGRSILSRRRRVWARVASSNDRATGRILAPSRSMRTNVAKGLAQRNEAGGRVERRRGYRLGITPRAERYDLASTRRRHYSRSLGLLACVAEVAEQQIDPHRLHRTPSKHCSVRLKV